MGQRLTTNATLLLLLAGGGCATNTGNGAAIGAGGGALVGAGIGALGDTVPVGDNTTDAGRQQNRRVQVEIAANEELRKKDAEAQQPAGQQAAAQQH